MTRSYTTRFTCHCGKEPITKCMQFHPDNQWGIAICNTRMRILRRWLKTLLAYRRCAVWLQRLKLARTQRKHDALMRKLHDR